MSWLSDGASWMYKNGMKNIPAYRMFDTFGAKNAYTDFVDSEIAKADLRGAELESFVSGFPIVGNIIKGVEGVNQLEDLYNNTGKIPEYPGTSGVGAQGLASAATGITRKIEEGSHDLGEYYSGDRDLNDVFENTGHAVVKHGTGRISKYGGF